MLQRSRLLEDAHFQVPVDLWKEYIRQMQAAGPEKVPAPVDLIAAEGLYDFQLDPAAAKPGLAVRITLRVLNPPGQEPDRPSEIQDLKSPIPGQPAGQAPPNARAQRPAPVRPAPSGPVRVLSTQWVWENVRVNGQPAKLPEKDGWLVYVPESAGEHVITAETTGKWRVAAGGRASLPVPPTVLTLLTVRSNTDLEIEVDGRRFASSPIAPAGRRGLEAPREPTPRSRGGLSDQATDGDSITRVPLTARDRLAFDWQRPQPTRPRPPRFELRGHVAWNLDTGSEQVAARLNVRIIGDPTEQVELSLPAAAERAEITGPDVREVQARAGSALVHLRGRIAEQTRLDVKFSLPERKGEQRSLPAVGIADGHWAESSHSTVVVTNTAGGIVLEGATRGLRELALQEIPTAAAAMLAGAPALAYEISARDFDAKVDLVDLGELALTESIADLGHFELLLARDGSVLCKAQYEVRNRTRQFLRVDLPPRSRVLMARVNEKPCPVTPVAGEADAVLLPLVRSTASVRGLVSFPVEIVVMTRVAAPGKSQISDLKSEIALPLPRIDVPVAYAWCETHIPSAMDVRRWSGPMTSVQRYSSETAQAYIGYGRGERAEGFKGLSGPESTEQPPEDHKPAAGKKSTGFWNWFGSSGQAPAPLVVAKETTPAPNAKGPKVQPAKPADAAADGKGINAGLLLARNYWRSGRDYYENNDFANAEKSLNKAIETAPESNEAANARRLLDNIRLASGKLALKGKSEIAAGEKVRQEQRYALKDVSERQQELLTQAGQAAAAGRYEQARSQLQVAQSLGEKIIAQGGDTGEQTYRLKQVKKYQEDIEGKESGQVSQLRSQLEMSKKRGDLDKAAQAARQLRNLAPDVATAAEAQKELEELTRTSAKNEAMLRQRDLLAAQLQEMTAKNEALDAETAKMRKRTGAPEPAQPSAQPSARRGDGREVFAVDLKKDLDEQVADLNAAIAAKAEELDNKLGAARTMLVPSAVRDSATAQGQGRAQGQGQPGQGQPGPQGRELATTDGEGEGPRGRFYGTGAAPPARPMTTRPQPAPEPVPTPAIAPGGRPGLGIPTAAGTSRLVGGPSPRREPPVTMPPPPPPDLPHADIARQDAEKLNEMLREPVREMRMAQAALAEKTRGADSTTVKVFIPENGDAYTVADALNRILGSEREQDRMVQEKIREAGEPGEFQADSDGDNSLILTGPKDKVDRAVAALRGMEIPQGRQQVKRLAQAMDRLETLTDRTVDLRGRRDGEVVDSAGLAERHLLRSEDIRERIARTPTPDTWRPATPPAERDAEARRMADSTSGLAAAPEIRVVALKHSDSAEVAKVLNNMFRQEQDEGARGQADGERLQVAADARTNALVLRGSTKQLDQAIALLQQLDSAAHAPGPITAPAAPDSGVRVPDQYRSMSPRYSLDLDGAGPGGGGGGGGSGAIASLEHGRRVRTREIATAFDQAMARARQAVQDARNKEDFMRAAQEVNYAQTLLATHRSLLADSDFDQKKAETEKLAGFIATSEDQWQKRLVAMQAAEIERGRLTPPPAPRPHGTVLDVEGTISADRRYVTSDDIRPPTGPSQDQDQLTEIRRAAVPWYDLLRYPRDWQETTTEGIAPAGRRGLEGGAEPTPRFRGGLSTPSPGETGQQTVTLTYDVRDLILKVPNFQGPRVGLSDAPATQPATGSGLFAADEIVTTAPAVEAEKFKQVKDLISSTVGGGSVRELNGRLVVTGDPERQRQVQDLLAGLREGAAPQVQLDAQRLTEQRAKGLDVGGTFLDDAQVDFLINATRSSRSAQTLTAPRITLYDGQAARVAAADGDERTQTNRALQRFIVGNYDWQTGTVTAPAGDNTGRIDYGLATPDDGGWSYGAATGVRDMSGSIASPPVASDQLTGQLGRNLGQKIAVNSTNINVDASTAERLGVNFVTGNNGATFAVVDEAQVRALLELEARNLARPTDAPNNDRIQDTIVGTDALLANGMIVNNPFAGDLGNALVLADNTVNLAHEKVLLISNGGFLTAVKAGPIQHWTEAAPEEVRFAEVPHTVDVPRVGQLARFEKKLIQPSDQLVIRVKYQWKGDSQ